MIVKTFLVLIVTAYLAGFTLPVRAILDNGGQFTPDSQHIIFHSYRDKAGELWIMKRDGTDAKKLTHGDNHDRWPVLSGNGRKVAFISRRSGNWDVWSIDIDGSNLKQITDTPENELGASFSPNDKQIVFSRSGADQNARLFIANADGSDAEPIISGGVWPLWNAAKNKILYGKYGPIEHGIYVYDVVTRSEIKLVGGEKNPFSATWSENGELIYLVQDGISGREIYRMHSDGNHLENLGLKAQPDSRPMVSPDRHQIIWGHARFGGADIFSYDFDNKIEVNLTPNSHFEGYPDINRQNASLLITSKRDGNSEIYLIDRDRKPVNLTQSLSEEISGRWSSDGEMLSYSSNVGGVYNVFIMDRKGNQKRQLTYNEKDTFASDWSPDGKFIIVTSNDNGQLDTSVVESNTGTPVMRLSSDKIETDGAFTPDGKSIIFVRGEGDDFEIVQKSIESGEERNLLEIKGRIYAPAVSPNGRFVTFSSDRDGDLEIFTIDSDGKNMRQLTDNFRRDNNPRWSADGSFIIFDSDRFGNYESFKINVDGTGRSKLDVGLPR